MPRMAIPILDQTNTKEFKGIRFPKIPVNPKSKTMKCSRIKSLCFETVANLYRMIRQKY